MASSQFKMYASSDPQGPGEMTGLTGSLIRILDACLVEGYGTGSYYKSPAGWTKPLMNYSNSVSWGPQLACYKQGSGSLCTLFVNDSSPNATPAGKEAWFCGFEQILSLTASAYPSGTVFTASAGNGTGVGQFPTPAQLNTYGHCVWRKSTSADSVKRPWFMLADERTFYFFAKTGDNGDTYYAAFFGDFFTLNPEDRYRCMIAGRISENAGLGIANSQDWMWVQVTGAGSTPGGSAYGPNWNAQPGHFIQRGAGGAGQSIPFSKKGDCCGTSVWATTPPACNFIGVYSCPSGFDNSIIMHPVQVIQSDCAGYRGRMRGLYQVCHSLSNFADGQLITGGGDYYGKTFMIVKPDYHGVSGFAIEVSPTVETNNV